MFSENKISGLKSRDRFQNTVSKSFPPGLMFRVWVQSQANPGGRITAQGSTNFHVLIQTTRTNKHCKYRCFWRVGSSTPRYLRCFLPLVAKITVFTMFFGQHLAKTLVFTEVSPCGKMWFLNPKRTKIL